MADNTDLINQFRQIVREENEPLKQALDEQGRDIKALKADIHVLKEDIHTVEMKVELVNNNLNTTKQEIIERIDSDEKAIAELIHTTWTTTDGQIQEIEERLMKLEKHTGIPHNH